MLFHLLELSLQNADLGLVSLRDAVLLVHFVDHALHRLVNEYADFVYLHEFMLRECKLLDFNLAGDCLVHVLWSQFKLGLIVVLFVAAFVAVLG